MLGRRSFFGLLGSVCALPILSKFFPEKKFHTLEFEDFGCWLQGAMCPICGDPQKPAMVKLIHCGTEFVCYNCGAQGALRVQVSVDKIEQTGRC